MADTDRETERTGDRGVCDESDLSDKLQCERRSGKISDELEEINVACRERQGANTSKQNGCLDLVFFFFLFFYCSSQGEV